MLLSFVVQAAPPTRVYDYVPLTTIQSDQVEANENSIFSYLQSGVEVYKDGTIVNADISTSAAIASTKLDLTSIAQNIVNTGNFTNTGVLTNTGNLSVTGTATISSSVTASSYALASGNTVLNYITTASQGSILYNNGSNWVNLSPGTSGYFLKTNGASTNPSWGSLEVDGAAYTTAGSYTWVAPAGKAIVFVSCVGGGAGGSGAFAGSTGGGGGGAGAYVIRQAVAITPSSGYTVTVGAAGTGGAASNLGTSGGASSFVGDNATVSCNGGSASGSSGVGGAGGTASGTAIAASGSTGGGIGQSSAGGAGANQSAATGGGGGGNPFGVGGNGSGSGVGGNATGRGSAGGGGFSSGTLYAGGNGSAGLVYLEW
jgi:hypothetical protein